MACKTNEYDLTRDVWTKGTTSDEVFVPFVRLRTNDAPRVRMSYLALGTAQLLCRRAWRYSNDGVTWTTPSGRGPDFAAQGSWSWATDYLITLTTYQWVEYGIISKNSSGTVLESGKVRAVLAVRDDKLSGWGSVPTEWGTIDSPNYGLSRATSNNRVSYYSAHDPYGDVFDTPGGDFTLAAVSQTDSGDPSGPGAWGSVPYWIAYDKSTSTWRVYSDIGGVPTAVGSSLAGDEQAVARVSVVSTTATFDVSFDGVSWTVLHTQSGTWTYRVYVVQNATTWTVLREQRS